MGLLGLGIRLSAGRQFRAFEAACRAPEAAQREALATMLAAARETAFGREHGFAAIGNPTAYAAAVPVRDYEGHRPYVARMAAGEVGVLTAESPELFTTTSGTTGEPKLIPVTPSWRRQMTALLRLWMYGAVRDHPGCFNRRVLTIVSPAIEGLTPAGIPYGAMSGLTNQRAPGMIRRQYATPYEVALVADYEARYRAILRLALGQSLSAIVTPNPSTLMRLAQVAEAHGEALIRALFDGTLGQDWPETIPQAGLSDSGVREALLAAIKPERARARALARAAERDGKLLPRHAWPRLELIGCWLGGSAGLQARHLAAAYGERVALRDVGLLASEGRLSVPLEDGTAAGPLNVHANYYEFIPEDAIDAPAPPVLGAHQLALGQRYYVLLTGGNGLYRYDLNDIVEVQGFFHATPCVAFIRKGRDMVSITGEKLHLNQLQQALREAEAATGLAVWQFRFVPDVEAATYDMLVEFSGGVPGEQALQAFQARFDAALAGLNPEYAAKRESGRLGCPRLHAMAAGWAERATQADFASGKRDAQFKWQAIRLQWEPAHRAEVRKTLGSDGRTPPETVAEGA